MKLDPLNVLFATFVVNPAANAFGFTARCESLRRATATSSTSRLYESTSALSNQKSPRPGGTGGYEGEFIDEKKAYDTWDFPYAPDVLVDMAKALYDQDVRYGTKDGGACLAEDFEFVGAVVGPLDKQAYLNGLKNFDLEQSFDIEGNIYGFYADPVQPGRVWFFNRARATHTGTFLGAKPTGNVLELPPQINFFQFNEEGKVKEFSFYTVDRRQGNTGGLGGAYGYMYGIGRSPPFPEARPFKPSLRYRIFNKIVSTMQ